MEKLLDDQLINDDIIDKLAERPYASTVLYVLASWWPDSYSKPYFDWAVMNTTDSELAQFSNTS